MSLLNTASRGKLLTLVGIALSACSNDTNDTSENPRVSKPSLEAPHQALSDPQLKKGPSVVFLEGPAWRSDGVLFFTDIPNNKIMRWNGKGPTQVHRSPSGLANGLVFDSQDRMIIAETTGRIVREDLDGKISIVTDQYEGKPYNAPNDLALDTTGRIYFTDTRYRNRDGATQRDDDGNIINAVYRIDINGKVVRILNEDVTAPNGILISPNDEYLYIADNDSRPGGKRTLVRFDLDNQGNVIPNSKAELYDWGTDRGPDGMTIDSLGNIYVTAGLNHALPGRTNEKHKAGIYVFSPEGQSLKTIPIPMDSTSNVTFGGPDYDTLYVTAGHTIWMYDVDIKGYRPFK